VDHIKRPGASGHVGTVACRLTRTGHLLLCPRRPLDPRTKRLAPLESVGQVQRTWRGRKDTALVVGRQQLEGARGKIAVKKHEAGEERVRGMC
jgi:hypothetical protein